MIPPSATRGSFYTADISSHTEFRAQVVSLTPGSYYSISAMLEPRVLKNEWDPPSAPRSPARHIVPGCRAAASDASFDPYGPRARARRPRGAMLAISGFQSTAPAARRGEKCPICLLLLLA